MWIQWEFPKISNSWKEKGLGTQTLLEQGPTLKPIGKHFASQQHTLKTPRWTMFRQSDPGPTLVIVCNLLQPTRATKQHNFQPNLNYKAEWFGPWRPKTKGRCQPLLPQCVAQDNPTSPPRAILGDDVGCSQRDPGGRLKGARSHVRRMPLAGFVLLRSPKITGIT